MTAFGIATLEGEFVARYSALGLCELNFPGRSAEGVSPREPARDSAEFNWHRITKAAVEAILRGDDPEGLPPLDLGGHTPFRRKVWAEMQRIRRGETVSYSKLAERIGDRKAVRAVGGACGANPIPLIIPCHRVLAAGQRLGGFSGGLEWKRKLLAVENISYISAAGERRRIHAEQGELAGFR